LGTEAGERFTVIRLAGNDSPEFAQAALTLAVDSDNEASGNPTNTKFGRLEEMSASTSIVLPPNPKRETEYERARAIRTPA
jgi:folate-binding Fe-S cluster repair protein YgfZ